jgi:hypothetical protein
MDHPDSLAAKARPEPAGTDRHSSGGIWHVGAIYRIPALSYIPN